MKLFLDEKENKLEEIDQKYQILTDNMADMVFQLKLSGKNPEHIQKVMVKLRDLTRLQKNRSFGILTET